MKKFSDLGIKLSVKKLIGEKIPIEKILGQEIIIEDFRIEDSKIFNKKGLEKCLYLQLQFEGNHRVIFTSASGMIEAISQMKENDFPFKTTIIKRDRAFLFS